MDPEERTASFDYGAEYYAYSLDEETKEANEKKGVKREDSPPPLQGIIIGEPS